jgi:hypothetical protein
MPFVNVPVRGVLTYQETDDEDEDDKDDTLAEKLRAAMELIRKVQRSEIAYICDGKVPLDVQGTLELPAIPPRDYVTEYLAEKQI